jgi:hypothetical protein
LPDQRSCVNIENNLVANVEEGTYLTKQRLLELEVSSYFRQSYIREVHTVKL